LIFALIMVRIGFSRAVTAGILMSLSTTQAFTVPHYGISSRGVPGMNGRAMSTKNILYSHRDIRRLSPSQGRLTMSSIPISPNDADMSDSRASQKPVSGLSPAGEWHSLRRRNILAKYPELRKLETEDWRGGALLLVSNALQMWVSSA
jgi:hypothetical protein